MKIIDTMKEKLENLKWNRKFRLVTKTGYHYWKAWTLGCGIGWALTEVNKRIFKANKKAEMTANLIGYVFCLPICVAIAHKETQNLELDIEDFDERLEITVKDFQGDSDNNDDEN